MLFCRKNSLVLLTRFIFLLLFLGIGLQIPAQCLQGSPAHGVGENLTYEVAYNWGLIWVDAGRVEFEVDTIRENGKLAYHFDSYGESYGFYDWFYKVRDHYSATVGAEDLQPMWFVRNTSEGGFMVNNRYEYRWEEGTVISHLENSKRALQIDTLAIKPCTFDVLSAIYYARSLSFDELEVGDKLPIRFLIDGEFYELFIRYQGRELKKNRGGKAYDCIKFSAMLVEGTIFKGGEDMTVWVTADENKVPIMVEAKILIGSIKAYLLDHQNTRSEVNAME